jgi:hypothetical protein
LLFFLDFYNFPFPRGALYNVLDLSCSFMAFASSTFCLFISLSLLDMSKLYRKTWDTLWIKQKLN